MQAKGYLRVWNSLSLLEVSMKTCGDNAPENCNNCTFKQNMSQHWDLEDYCTLNKKSTSIIIMDRDCPLQKGVK